MAQTPWLLRLQQDSRPQSLLSYFRFPQVDFDPLSVHSEPRSFLILKLNRSTWKHLCESEWFGEFWFDLPGNKRKLELNRSTRLPTTNSRFSIFRSWYFFIFSLYRADSHMLLGKNHQAHSIFDLIRHLNPN